MKSRSKNFSRSWGPPAFTLVEVVASLMLLGTLLVGMLVAHQRHTSQIRRAQTRLRALQAADKLLTHWSDEGTWGPATPSGHVEGSKNLMWRWNIIRTKELDRFGAAIGRLEISEDRSEHEAPLVRLEVLTTGGVGSELNAGEIR